MSIFDPIPRESRWDERDDGGQEFDDATSDDELAPERTSLDPRSIKIAGLVLASVVALGLIVSNTAEPETRPRSIAVRVDPGAAAIDHAEAAQVDRQPAASASAPPAADDTNRADDDAEPVEYEVDTDAPSRESKWDDGKPGKGNGRGRG